MNVCFSLSTKSDVVVMVVGVSVAVVVLVLNEQPSFYAVRYSKNRWSTGMCLGTTAVDTDNVVLETAAHSNPVFLLLR